MVFKKGHTLVKKKSSVIKTPTISKKQLNDVSDYYVKFGIKNDMKNNLSNLSYLVATLKNDLNIINNLRGKKAFLRKELYETLISLRLNVDSLERHMPSKEFEALKNKIEEISKYAKKETVKKSEPSKKIEKPAPVIKPEVIKKEFDIKKPEPVIEKKSDLYNNASDKEKKELEALKRDLEEISNQLKNKE
ncbi:MAG: hypothetical protein PHN56_00585 [Candidatus Nanoarchaeia archaeon]|nr:hypothetical protein [Candidatus Nanoarchaeia archaeon]